MPTRSALMAAPSRSRKDAQGELVALLALWTLACADPDRGRDSAAGASESAHGEAVTSIRSVDFANFAYRFGDDSWTLRGGEQPAVYERSEGASFVAKSGYRLESVEYGDLTGDAREDAVVAIFETTGGTAATHYAFVYVAGEPMPRLLWSFRSGDRAAGGLKRADIEGGNFIVELFGKSAIIGSGVEAENDPRTGLCCPLRFTRLRYRWAGDRFTAVGQPEVLPYIAKP